MQKIFLKKGRCVGLFSSPCWCMLLLAPGTIEAPVILIGVGVVLVGGGERDQPFLPPLEMPPPRELR